MGRPPEFNPDLPFSEKRVLDKRQTLLQNGYEFTLRHDYIGLDPDYEIPEDDARASLIPEPTPEQTGKEGVLARAQAKLEGFSNPENVSDAGKENSRALAAERLSE